jgi:hypothetical protein
VDFCGPGIEKAPTLLPQRRHDAGTKEAEMPDRDSATRSVSEMSMIDGGGTAILPQQCHHSRPRRDPVIGKGVGQDRWRQGGVTLPLAEEIT